MRMGVPRDEGMAVLVPTQLLAQCVPRIAKQLLWKATIAHDLK
jgi:hypothetical protein